MDLKSIPYSTYEKLALYLGNEKAYEYIKEKKYNYQAVITKILILDIKGFLKKKSFIYTILFFLLIIVFLILFFEDLIFF